MYDEPQNLMHLVLRATRFLTLGFADLAAGDAYKAVRLLDATLRCLLGGSTSNYEDLSGRSLEIEAASANAANLQRTGYRLLLATLFDIGDERSAKAIIQEARVRYPTHPDLEEIEKSLAIRLEEARKTSQLKIVQA